MLASYQPQPPHLLHTQPTPFVSLDVSNTIHTALPAQPIGARGLKGFFSRARIGSAGPMDPSPSKSRSKSFGGPSNCRTPRALRPKDDDSRKQTGTPSSEIAVGQRQIPAGKTPETRSRPSSPDPARRIIRFAPSMLPAIQKGEDGRWQPPSLSRGSHSTSALALYAKEEAVPRPVTPSPDKARKKGHKHSLSLLFTNRHGIKGFSAGEGLEIEDPSNCSGADRAKSDADTPNTSTKKCTTRQEDIQLHALADRTIPTVTPPHPFKSPSEHDMPNIHPELSRQPRTPPSPSTRSPGRSPSIPVRTSSSSRIHGPNPLMPIVPLEATVSKSSSNVLLSHEYYLLRWSASYIVKSLTPVIRGSGFTQHERNAEMRRLADERLTALKRMEDTWDSHWAQQINEDLADPSRIGSLEGKLQSFAAVEIKTKDGEMRSWFEAIEDGILLCFLLNHLFPSHPPRIPRLNISEDGFLRATNITRFISASQTIGLADSDLFGLQDLQDASEISVGRIASTVAALARLASRVTKDGRRSSCTPRAIMTPDSPMLVYGSAPIHIRRRQRDAPASPMPVSTGSTFNQEDLSQNVETEPTTRYLTSDRVSLDGDDASAWRTPTTSTFASPKADDDIVYPPRMARATTPPYISPSLRTGSPSPGQSPSRVRTPIGRPSSLAVRPALRPRHTTGSRIQVTFVNGSELHSPPRNESTSTDNTPTRMAQREHSLVSLRSQVVSGSAASNAAFSESTEAAHDVGSAVNTHELDFEEATVARLWERRMSERTLQDARQKIIRTLLSSDDLPRDLRDAIEERSSRSLSEDARDFAHSQSLAALEGWRPPTKAIASDVSPRHRPSVRRGQSLDVSWQDVDRVVEEDEPISASNSLVRESARPSVVRRFSANAKFVPKRSNSPAPPGFVDRPFPSLAPVQTASDFLSRRRSDGYEIGAAVDSFERPMNMKINSMINLSTTSSKPPLLRDGSASSVLRTQSLQVLEFTGPGSPSVKYQLGNCIGRGQFGSVYRSLNLGTGQMVAIKRIRLAGMKEEEVRDVMREVDLLKRLSHPNIVKYEGMSRDEEYLNIVLEFVENGSLGQTLKAFGRFNEKLASSYVAKILEGLDYLHSQGVVHCDLKAANILSTKNGNVKLSDFGVSLNMKAVENIKQEAVTASKARGLVTRPVSDVAGTPNWMAPEVISLNGASPASDMWSLGCTIIELITGKPPYAEITNSMTVLFRIVEDEMPPLPEEISDDLGDFLRLCFIKDPKARPEAVVMFEHPWVKKLNPDLALRPQDSVPFLRRVSMDSRGVESSRLFPEQGGLETKPHVLSSTPDHLARKGRDSMASSDGRDGSDGDPKRHHLIKTTFAKAIICRVCHGILKKTGVLCEDCGMLCHTACAAQASSRCDIDEQLALLAHQREFLSDTPPSDAVLLKSSVDDDLPLVGLPVKILNGWRRSKSALKLDRPSSVDLLGRRSTVEPCHSAPGYEYARRSMETNPSSVDSRGSMYSAGTDSDGDGRRRSAIRFGLCEEVQENGSGEGVNVRPPSRAGRGHHQRARVSKSECVIM